MSPLVTVRDPSGNHTIRQFPMRGVSQGTIAPHCWASVNGNTAYIPIGVEVELGEAFVSALTDSGFVVTPSEAEVE